MSECVVFTGRLESQVDTTKAGKCPAAHDTTGGKPLMHQVQCEHRSWSLKWGVGRCGQWGTEWRSRQARFIFLSPGLCLSVLSLSLCLCLCLSVSVSLSQSLSFVDCWSGSSRLRNYWPKEPKEPKDPSNSPAQHERARPNSPSSLLNTGTVISCRRALHGPCQAHTVQPCLMSQPRSRPPRQQLDLELAARRPTSHALANSVLLAPMTLYPRFVASCRNAT